MLFVVSYHTSKLTSFVEKVIQSVYLFSELNRAILYKKAFKNLLCFRLELRSNAETGEKRKG